MRGALAPRRRRGSTVSKGIPHARRGRRPYYQVSAPRSGGNGSRSRGVSLGREEVHGVVRETMGPSVCGVLASVGRG
jgi:hypothetical protein